MANIQKQFEKFHESIRTDYDTNKELREKRDIILEKIEQSLTDAHRPRFRRLMQGSYIMRTGVMPVGDKEYDIDVGLHFSINEKDYSAADVRSWVLAAIENHTKSVESKGPCVRVRYAKGFHVDLVAYATWTDDWGREQCRLAHESKGWIAADPSKLIAFVNDAQARFSDTEGGTQTSQLRRVIRALKRWDDVCLPDESEAKPSGLAFTLFTINHLTKTTRFDGTPDDRAALASLATYAASITRLSEVKPTPEYEDMFARLDAKNMTELLKRFATMNTALREADSEPDPVKACELLRAVFGDDFPIPPPDETGEKTKAPAIITSSASG